MKPADEPGQAMQRVKVGMTGLAIVLLLIGLATAIFGSVGREHPVMSAGASKPVVAHLAGNDAAAGEPLAELGVAPSTQTNDSAAVAGNP